MRRRFVKAVWNGAVLAESDTPIVVEGNYYFPPETVNRDYVRESDAHTRCYWKGVASYYTIEVEGKRNVDAAWYYPKPSPQAQKIAGYIAFWRGVQVVE
jgi:uncharacterized protein (DUF427 family)